MTVNGRLEALNGFLDKHNCKAKFYKYRNEYYTEYNMNCSYERMVTTTVPREVFSSAFSWTTTDEGCPFWNGLADEWAAKFV